MTKEVLIDTNVLIVANRKSEHTDEMCAQKCIEYLELIRESHCTLVDDNYLIFSEYETHLSHRGQPGVGDAFFKWLHNNQGQADHCRNVSITPLGQSGEFAEYPSDAGLANFDRSDRKFIAVWVASGTSPDILNAVDSDWWNARDALNRCGINVEYLCPNVARGNNHRSPA